MESNKLQLTALENQVMHSFISLLYAEPGFSDIDAHDLARDTKIPTRSIRGVLSSLVQKGIISIDENGADYQIVYLNPSHWHLHPEWKEEYDETRYGKINS